MLCEQREAESRAARGGTLPRAMEYVSGLSRVYPERGTERTSIPRCFAPFRQFLHHTLWSYWPEVWSVDVDR